ncbi:ribonuclease P protein subunit p21 isoform X2 [Ciconia boyciana]|uniref:ribonuclease P protein subunit p21 isoform X2 n=1 Tax=Ciconia boyciana TaxID=52775 RepID=UPI003BA1B836
MPFREGLYQGAYRRAPYRKGDADGRPHRKIRLGGGPIGWGPIERGGPAHPASPAPDAGAANGERRPRPPRGGAANRERDGGARAGSRGAAAAQLPLPGRALGAPPQPRPRPLLLQHPARGRPPPRPAHGPLGEASRVPPLLLPPAARGRGCLRLRGGGQPRAVLRCRSCGRFRRYLCQRELRPLGQAPPTGPALDDNPA